MKIQCYKWETERYGVKYSMTMIAESKADEQLLRSFSLGNLGVHQNGPNFLSDLTDMKSFASVTEFNYQYIAALNIDGVPETYEAFIQEVTKHEREKELLEDGDKEKYTFRPRLSPP